MNKRFLLPIVATALLTTSCVAAVNQEQGMESLSESQIELTKTETAFIDITQQSVAPSFQLEPLTEFDGLPVELVNRIREAVYQNKVEELIGELSDNEFLMTQEDVVAEQEVYDSIAEGVREVFIPERSFYRISLDDKTGILEFTDDIYGVRNWLYLKNSDNMVKAQHLYIDYGRAGTYFQYDGKDFIITYEFDYSEKLFCVALYLLSYENDELVVDTKVSFKEQKRLSAGQIVYAVEDHPDLADIIEYLQGSLEDTVWVSREKRMFYGDEVVRPDLLTKFKEIYPEIYEESLICAIDVDNDGIDEIYSRDAKYSGSPSYRIIRWYDEDLKRVSEPFKAVDIPQYYLKNTWFKEFGNKVLVFSIHEKQPELDQYLVNVQMIEQGEAVTLLEYLINLDTSDISVTDSFFETYQLRETTKQWKAPDYSTVYSDNVEEIINDFVTERAEYSYKIKYDNIQNASPVYDNVQQLIISQQLYAVDDTLGMSSAQIDASDFYQKNYDNLKVYDPDCEGGYIPRIDAVYQKEYNNQVYYLLLYLGDNRNESNQMDVYLAENGGLVYSGTYKISVSDSKIIQNSDGIFLVKRELNGEDKKYLPDITVHSLAPVTEDVIVIRPDTTGFSWKLIYSDQLSHEGAVGRYIEQIREELMSVSVTPEDNQFYVGDERADFDSDLQARLKSVCHSRYDFYQTDYNNDGQADYILRRSDEGLKLDFYHFVDNQTIKINYGNSDYAGPGQLLQIWYQKIDNQVFTFQLFLKDGRYYILDVSLMKDTQVTAVQRYLIVPEVEYYIE